MAAKWEELEFFTGDSNGAVRRMQHAERLGCLRRLVDVCAETYARLPYLKNRHPPAILDALARKSPPHYRRLEMPYAMMAGHWREFFLPDLGDRPEDLTPEKARAPWLDWFAREIALWHVDRPGLIEKVCLLQAASETRDIEDRASDLHLAMSAAYWEKSKFF